MQKIFLLWSKDLLLMALINDKVHQAHIITELNAGDAAATLSIRGRVCGYDPRPRPSHSDTPPGQDGCGSGDLSAARAEWVELWEGGAKQSHSGVERAVLSTGHLHQ